MVTRWPLWLNFFYQDLWKIDYSMRSYLTWVPCRQSCLRLRNFSSKLNSSETLDEFTPILTNIPTMYTCAPLDPFISFDHIKHKSTLLFKQQQPRYIHPKELNYELPNDGLPEFAFVGRSNVGKSTLIGALLGDSSLGLYIFVIFELYHDIMVNTYSSW